MTRIFVGSIIVALAAASMVNLPVVEAQEQRICRTVANHVFGVDKESFDLGSQLIMDRDFVALRKLTAQNRAGILKGGIRVHLVSPGFLRTTFRLPGSTLTLWTAAEAIKCR